MNKSELATKMSMDAGITKAAATKALESFLEGVGEELRSDGKVVIVGFGTFSIKKRAARLGRNPKTGVSIDIPAMDVAHFKPSKNLLNP